MGLIKESFGWVLGLEGTAIEKIDVARLDETVRGVQRLGLKWEREMRGAQKEYSALMDADANLRRSKIEIRLSLRKARIAARRLQTYERMSLLLERMRSVVSEVKTLKEYAQDLQKAGRLKAGVKLSDLRGEFGRIGLVVDTGRKQLEEIEDALGTVQQAMTDFDDAPAVVDDVIVELFERLQTLKADGRGDTDEARELQEKIDRSMGLSVAVVG